MKKRDEELKREEKNKEKLKGGAKKKS